MPGGRPTKLTPELTARLCKLLRQGMSIEGSCDLIGIRRSTYHDWMQQAGSGSEEHVAFSDEVARARATAELRCVKAIMAAAKLPKDVAPDHKAAAWFLSHARRSHGWADTVRNEHTGAEGGPVKVEDVTPAKARALINEVFSSAGATDNREPVDEAGEGDAT